MSLKFKRWQWASAVGIVALVTAIWVAQAGNLDPPAPPAPTMKTLEEVEPRIPIHASDLPMTITAPGSYYLTEDIVTAGGGISISKAVRDVTIDLRGFRLAGGTGSGISGGVAYVEVRNGTVTGWDGYGVLVSGTNSRIINVHVHTNGSDGIYAGSNAHVERCKAYNNTTNGISVSSGRVIDSIASLNTGNGILARSIVSSVVITGSIADDNTLDGIAVLGTGAGLGDGSVISGCLVRENGGDGIEVADGVLVSGNTGARNGTGAGIHVTGTDNRIDSNNVITNDFGIQVDGIGNVIMRNSASGNVTADYSIVGGNDVGPLGTAAASASPWANIVY